MHRGMWTCQEFRYRGATPAQVTERGDGTGTRTKKRPPLTPAGEVPEQPQLSFGCPACSPGLPQQSN